MTENYIHKIMKIFIQTKLNGKEIDFNNSSADIIRKAEQDRDLYRYNDDTYFCCYKTIYKNKPAIIMVFTMRLSGPPSGSSSASEYVINIISMLEKQFLPLAHKHYCKEIGPNKKIIGLLRVVKYIEDEKDPYFDD